MVQFNDIITSNSIEKTFQTMALANISLKKYLQATVGYVPNGLQCLEKTEEGYEILETSYKYITSAENYVTQILRSKKWMPVLKIKHTMPDLYMKICKQDEKTQDEIGFWFQVCYEYISPDCAVLCKVVKGLHEKNRSYYTITFQFTGEPIELPDNYYEEHKKKIYDFYGNEIELIDSETAREISNEYWKAYRKQREYTIDYNIEYNSELQILLSKEKRSTNFNLQQEEKKMEKRLITKHHMDTPEYIEIMEKEKQLRQYMIHHLPRGVIQSKFKSYQLSVPCADLCAAFRKFYGLKGFYD